MTSHSLSSDSPTEDPRAVLAAALEQLYPGVLDQLSAAGFVVVAATGGPCATCNGLGWPVDADGTAVKHTDCASCNGTGRAATGLQHGDQLEQFEVDLQPGADAWRRVGTVETTPSDLTYDPVPHVDWTGDA